MSNIEIDYLALEACTICGSANINLVVELPNYPLTEFTIKNSASPQELVLDQRLFHCSNCDHFFLEKQISPSLLYSPAYQTSSKSFSSSEMHKRMLSILECKRSLVGFDSIIDIGANDGSLLKLLAESYKDKSYFAIDPIWESNGYEDSKRTKISGINAFFEDIEDFGFLPPSKARFFIATHMLEHVLSPKNFFEVLSKIARANDKVLFQIPIMESVIRDNFWESIHHQHLQYFTFQSFNFLIDQFGFQIEECWIDDLHYGAATIIISRKKTIYGVDEWCKLSRMVNVRDFTDSLVSFEVQIQSINGKLEREKHVGIGSGSLMAPILFYYLSPWESFSNLYDGNSSKVGMWFVNTPKSIETMPATLRGVNCVILGGTSRLTGRKLFNQASSLEARTITTFSVGA